MKGTDRVAELRRRRLRAKMWAKITCVKVTQFQCVWGRFHSGKSVSIAKRHNRISI